MEHGYRYTVKTKRRRVKMGRLLFLLALCAFLLSVLFSVRFIGMLNAFQDTSPWASALPQPVGNERRQAVLYTVSNRQGDGVVTELVLVAYHPGKKQARVIHLPTDTLVDAANHGLTRLGLVYRAGGRELLVSTVSRLFADLPVHYYLEIDEESLLAAVDRVGGIQLPTASSMAGGGEVLAFMHAEGLTISEKLERRRSVLTALAATLVQGSLLQRITSFYDVSPLLATNFSWRQLLSMAESLRDTEYSEAAKVILLPGTEQVRTDGRYWRPDISQISSLASWLTGDVSALPRAQITVEVLNGSGVRGLGTEVAEKLRAEGFQVLSIGNADRQDYDISQVISRTDNVDGAKEVAILVPGAQLLKQEVPESSVMVTVIVGKNYTP
ncbi:MAG: LCP family protein [Dethiobacter sp.]|nr:LCP family protein [Dethiobacter sp.]